ncbi:GntR family transcriptional regulator, partial [Microbacteriaceae bacterium K1510]|nr:GntR family transcriptional regulator [Microbacteriaceae bacterium K1510]
MQTPLTNQLAAQISDYIRAERAPKGARLVERALADRLMVSRSPIRSALRLLAAEGIVGNADRGGYVVLEPNRSFPRASLAAAGDEEAYYRVAEDRLKGTLPERISERALEREYGLTRVDLAKVLRRIANEGWIERLPGHGWRFLPMLTSLQSYEDSYRFRLTIEPAAILEPRFVLNIDALQKCRAQQERLVDGEIWRISKGDLFDINSHLHEAVIS